MKLLLTTSFLSIFIFSGCSLINSSDDSFKFKYFHSTKTSNFHIITRTLLDDLAPTILEIKAKRETIAPLYVTDFVNLDKLTNRSQLGFILSDELKTNTTQDLNWPIYQIEFSKYLKIGQTGTKFISRDVNDLKYKTIDENTYGLIGTYAITQRQLLLYLKFVNLKNGVILKSATKRITLTDEILLLEQKREEIQQQIYQPLKI